MKGVRDRAPSGQPLACCVYAYADTWWKTYKKTLFRWSGPSWEVPIFHKDWSYPLGPLVTYCDLNPSVCE